MTMIDLSDQKSGHRVFSSHALDGMRMLVTGASSGFGRAGAAALAACGARLAIAGRDQARLDETLAMLEGDGHRGFCGTLIDADQTADFIKDIARVAGPFDGIFHSAGAYLAQPVKTNKQRHIDAMFAASVWGAYGIARAAAQKTVMNDGGSIIFMSSVAAERGHPGTAAYAGAKAAIAGLVRASAIEFAVKRIRINAIVSGTVETEMHLATAEKLDLTLIEDGRSRHPLGFGRVEDLANAVTFLLSPASAWITGTTMHVDGGYMAR